MSRISVCGSARMEFDTDRMEIQISVRAFGKTSGEALMEGKAKTEKLLGDMQSELGIAPSSFILESDNISKQYNDKSYQFNKGIILRLPTDLKAAEVITDIIANTDDTEYNISFSLSNSEEKTAQVVNAAIADSRKKAELIASGLGQKITGAEEISLDSPAVDFIQERSYAKYLMEKPCQTLSSLLQPHKEGIEKSISITWLAE